MRERRADVCWCDSVVFPWLSLQCWHKATGKKLSTKNRRKWSRALSRATNVLRLSNKSRLTNGS